MIVFLVFLGCAALFYALVLHAMVLKLPVGIWSHEKERPKVRDVKAYNHVVARMFPPYGAFLILCSLPLLLFEMREVCKDDERLWFRLWYACSARRSGVN